MIQKGDLMEGAIHAMFMICFVICAFQKQRKSNGMPVMITFPTFTIWYLEVVGTLRKSHYFLRNIETIEVHWCGQSTEDSVKNIEDEGIEGLKIFIYHLNPHV